MSCFYLLIFYLILNLNLTFAVCRIREAYKCPLLRISDAHNLLLKKKLFHSTREIRFIMIASSSTLTLNFLKHYICICIVYILSCFVFLVCRAFLTLDKRSTEDCANTSYVFDIKEIILILFYSKEN